MTYVYGPSNAVGKRTRNGDVSPRHLTYRSMEMSANKQCQSTRALASASPRLASPHSKPSGYSRPTLVLTRCSPHLSAWFSHQSLMHPQFELRSELKCKRGAEHSPLPKCYNLLPWPSFRALKLCNRPIYRPSS
jgi:hypothetical protein